MMNLSWVTAIKNELRGDRVIWMILAILALFSLLAVYSATGSMAYRYAGGNTEAYLLKHAGIFTASLGVTWLCYRVPYFRYAQLAPFFLVISMVLLLYTMLFGVDVNEARRWIELPGIDISFQPSDFAKLALIVYIARAISAKQDVIKDFKSAFLPLIVPVILVCGLIAPANLSTAAMLFFTCIIMMFIGRVDMKYIFVLFFFGIVFLAMLIILGNFFPESIRVETWTSRLNEFFGGTGDNYQIHQAKIAIADGSWLGVGPGNSIQRNYLPYAYADFIFAIICEEYGLVGGFVIIALYLWLFFRCVRLVTISPKTFASLLAAGMGLALVVQAFANIAVSVNLVPVTGLTLPLISMGGTSLLFTCMAFGMILSVSRYIENKQLATVGAKGSAGHESDH